MKPQKDFLRNYFLLLILIVSLLGIVNLFNSPKSFALDPPKFYCSPSYSGGCFNNMQCQAGNECMCDSSECPGGFEPESCHCKSITGIFPTPPSLLMCTCECICPDCNDGKVNGNEECDPPFSNDGTCVVGTQMLACGTDCTCPKCEGNKSGPCPEPTDICKYNTQGNYYECVPKPCSQRTPAEGCDGAPGCSGSAECVTVGSICKCATPCESRGASSCSDSPNSCPAGEQCYPRTDGPDGCRCAPPPCDKCDDEKPVGFKKCSDDGSSVKQCKRHEFYHEQCSYQDIDLCNYNQFCEDALCKDKCTECSGRPLESTFCSFGNVVKKCKNDNNDDLCEEPTIEECGADKTCVQTSETTAECVPKCGNSQQDSGETCDSSAEPSGCGDNESCNDDCSGCTTTTTDSVDYSNSAPGL